MKIDYSALEKPTEDCAGGGGSLGVHHEKAYLVFDDGSSSRAFQIELGIAERGSGKSPSLLGRDILDKGCSVAFRQCGQSLRAPPPPLRRVARRVRYCREDHRHKGLPAQAASGLGATASQHPVRLQGRHRSQAPRPAPGFWLHPPEGRPRGPVERARHWQLALVLSQVRGNPFPGIEEPRQVRLAAAVAPDR